MVGVKPRTDMPKKRLTAKEKAVHPSAHGGVLRNRRRGRGRRPLSFRDSIHLVLRAWWGFGIESFTHPKNRRMVHSVLAKHAANMKVDLLGIGNGGNHLHLRARFADRKQYCRFIRAVTGEIALKIKKARFHFDGVKVGRLWQWRPFSSIIVGADYLASMINYIAINELEGYGLTRTEARVKLKKWRDSR